MPRPAVMPIGEHDLPAVGEFLNVNLNRRIPARTWSDCLRHPWCESRPNFGMQLRAGPTLVGVFCAIYSDQIVADRIEKFCNPHSWCVLPEYRGHALNLLLALLKQPGYHFTMLTPNPKVAQIFRQLRFRDLAAGIAIFPNLPALLALGARAVAVSDPAQIAALVSGGVRRDFELHRHIPWLNFVAFGRHDDVALAVYKRATWKRLPCARLIHLSDPAAFHRHGSLLSSHLLMQRGLPISHLETRFIDAVPRMAIRSRRNQAKLFLSATLKDAQVRDLYTELVALDI